MATGSSKAIARRAVRPAPAPVPEGRALDDLTTARMLAESGYFKDVRDAAQALAKILYGRELGVGPVTSLMGVHLIEGKPTASANLIASRIKGSGRYDYRVRAHSEERCAVEFFERGESVGDIVWDMSDVERAGLKGKPNWKRYPRQMLFARALSEGARVHCPDVFGGAPVYVPEELGAEVDAEGNVTYAHAKPQKAFRPEDDDYATDTQLDEIDRLSRDVAITDKERAGIVKRLGRGMERATAVDAIAWLTQTIAEREEAAAEKRNDAAPADPEAAGEHDAA